LRLIDWFNQVIVLRGVVAFLVLFEWSVGELVSLHEVLKLYEKELHIRFNDLD